MPLTKIQSLGITDGTIAAADIASGAITAAKLASGVGGKVIAHKYAIFQGTQTSTGASYADVTDLSITHTMSNSANKIIMFGHIGRLQTISGSSLSGSTAFVFKVDSTIPTSLIGTAAGNRPGVTISDGARGVNTDHSTSAFFMGVYLPADTSSHTYKVQVFCQAGETAYINYAYADANVDASYGARAISVFQLFEVGA
jgi:hypothetical protein